MAGAGSGSPALAFGYARGLAPMMWAFVVLGTIELLVVHLLLAALASPAAALAASFLTLPPIIWVVLLIRSLKRLPVLVDDDEIVLRTGTLLQARIARSNLAGIRTAWPDGLLKDRAVLNMALVAHPNLLIDLNEPIPVGRRRRMVGSVAHRLDDPSRFIAALACSTG